PQPAASDQERRGHSLAFRAGRWRCRCLKGLGANRRGDAWQQVGNGSQSGDENGVEREAAADSCRVPAIPASARWIRPRADRFAFGHG
ncbi:MAG: hypothetical protein O6758_03445, partial [Planctomycetota bacterium]|nr:hypothetical protein [Planctomycetota bacterium]